uniref:Mitochondrial inner membrane protein Mpv17 n=1 Tax=Arion vulgaris TaxID=1028688 RepID=A0A0B7BLR0_9EUPU
MAFRIWKIYQHALEKFPLPTMSCTTGILMATGDCVSQLVIERKQLVEYSGVRTGRFFVIGFCVFGPVLRGWYLTLDKLYTGKKFSALKMMATDQLCMSPILVGTFLTCMGVLRMDDFKTIKERLKRDYTTILINNYKIWPLAQMINFYFMPLRHRVLYGNVVALGWNIYLSWATEYELDTSVHQPVVTV